MSFLPRHLAIQCYNWSDIERFFCERLSLGQKDFWPFWGVWVDLIGGSIHNKSIVSTELDVMLDRLKTLALREKEFSRLIPPLEDFISGLPSTSIWIHYSW